MKKYFLPLIALLFLITFYYNSNSNHFSVLIKSISNVDYPASTITEIDSRYLEQAEFENLLLLSTFNKRHPSLYLFDFYTPINGFKLSDSSRVELFLNPKKTKDTDLYNSILVNSKFRLNKVIDNCITEFKIDSIWEQRKNAKTLDMELKYHNHYYYKIKGSIYSKINKEKSLNGTFIYKLNIEQPNGTGSNVLVRDINMVINGTINNDSILLNDNLLALGFSSNRYYQSFMRKGPGLKPPFAEKGWEDYSINNWWRKVEIDTIE